MTVSKIYRPRFSLRFLFQLICVGAIFCAGYQLGWQQQAQQSSQQDLIEIIQTTVAPDEWEDSNGSGTIEPYPIRFVLTPDGCKTIRDAADDPTDSAVANATIDAAGEDEDNPFRRP